MRPPPKRIVVAMSGGVDSSVVAGLLRERGHDVIGVTLQLYDHGVAVGRKGACCAGQDIYDAKTVADRLGIPRYWMQETDAATKLSAIPHRWLIAVRTAGDNYTNFSPHTVVIWVMDLAAPGQSFVIARGGHTGEYVGGVIANTGTLRLVRSVVRHGDAAWGGGSLSRRRRGV